MKKILFLLLIVLAACNQPVKQLSRGPADWIWVSTTGDDVTGDGTSGNPYETVQYAVSQATTGDTVYILAGTYSIATQLAIPVGVSLYGQGNTSILVLTYTTLSSTAGCLQLSSAPTEGTNGNQTISHLYIDGDLTGTNAIVVYCRSNVKVHDCTIIDFDQSGITFRGNNAAGEAGTKATGNQVYNCSLINSSTRGAVSDGLIRFSSQTNMSIHDNILIQTGKAEGSNGNILDAVGGYNSNIQYYNNKSYKPYSEGANWNFHIESWNGQGGWHVWNNEFYGGGCHIDIAGNTNVRGSYSYSWWVHDNLFKQDSLQPINSTYSTMGIDIERESDDIIIERNKFERLTYGVYITTDVAGGADSVHIRYNVFKEIGTTDNVFSSAILISAIDAAGTGAITNIFIDNNTMTAGALFNVGAGLITGIWAGTIDAIYFRNNITNGFYRGPIWISTGTGQVSTVNYYNNLANNTSNSIYYSSGETITTLNQDDNITGNPLFKSNETFRLRPTSTAIDAGLDVNLIKDYWGHRVGNSPDVGACEVGDYVLFYGGKQL